MRAGAGLATLALLAAAALAQPAEPPTFRARTLEDLPGSVSLATADFNGDGLPDLLLVAGRDLRVYVQRKELGFLPTSPDARPRVPAAAVCFDLGKVDDNPATDELVIVGPQGVSWFGWEGRALRDEPKPLVQAALEPGDADPERLLRRPAFHALEGRAPEDLVLPGPGALLLFRREGAARYAPAGRIAIAPPLSLFVEGGSPLDRLGYRRELPAFATGDLDGDRRPEVIVVDDHELRRWSRGEDGRVAGEPQVQPLPSLQVGKARLYRLNVAPLFQDLDGDGLLDLVMPEPADGSIRILMGSAKETWPREKPDRVIRIKEQILDVRAVDLDGDGLQDLVIPALDPIGVWDGINVFLSGSLTLRTYAFLLRKGEGFPAAPDLARSVSVPVSVRRAAGGFATSTVSLVSCDGDFTGDGRKDLLVGEGKDRLAVFPGVADGVISNTVAFEIEIPDTSGSREVSGWVEDLNRDGVHDAILVYRDAEKPTARLVFLLSRRAGTK